VSVPEIAWFHLGADLDASGSSGGIPDSAMPLLERLERAPAFLMVGTVEPRKGHLQVLRAFEHLWASGREATLVIVGKRGWMVDELCHRMETHDQLGRSLFWLSKASDELLEQLYARCTCLIAGSEGEGFGLPIIEAGQRGLPVIARDIPVFREVAGDHAFFFNQTHPDGLAREIDAWLDLHERGIHPRAEGLLWLTWAQSAERLKQLVLADATGVEPACDSPPTEPDGRSGRL
jgi:glycosyltransferase involved in cell wall biosynthesis